MLATLYIGWLIWAIVLAAKRRGQTPAKQLLGHRVINEDNGEPAGLFTMLFGRAIAPALIMPLLFALLIIPGVIALLLPFFGGKNKTIWERLSGTLVVYEQE